MYISELNFTSMRSINGEYSSSTSLWITELNTWDYFILTLNTRSTVNQTCSRVKKVIVLYFYPKLSIKTKVILIQIKPAIKKMLTCKSVYYYRKNYYVIDLFVYYCPRLN